MLTNMSRRRDISPQSRSSKLRMDRQPTVARITDPSLPIGKRKEIDNVMKKARASSNDYWDKKLLDIEEKDPNRWRHTGYKKMYIEGDSSSESEREGNFRYNNRFRSRSRSRNRKTPPMSPMQRKRSPPPDLIEPRRPRSPDGRRPPRSPDIRRRPRSPPPEPPMNRRRSPRSPRSPVENRGRGGVGSGGGIIGRSPFSPASRQHRPSPAGTQNKRGNILPRSKRPPSPPPKQQLCNSRSNSSLSSCSDDSCSVCSPKMHRPHSRSSSIPRSRPGPHSPPSSKSISNHSRMQLTRNSHSSAVKSRPPVPLNAGHHQPSSSRMRPISPLSARPEKYHEEKVARVSTDRNHRERIVERPAESTSRASRHSPVPEDPRLKVRPTEPSEPIQSSKKKKDKSGEKLRTKIKIEGEKSKKPQHSSSESEESSDSENSIPTLPQPVQSLTLSERFGRMAQWSIDRSNMENMRITKDSADGALKVMIEEELEPTQPPPRQYPPTYSSPAPPPAGHFPEELATTAPSGMLCWDDVRVRYEYYKSRGYLRDLDLKDYIRWEEWWYRYQEWLKQERYYEFWERQQQYRRRRKKIPIAQRLN